jgi:hypothetical protein
LCLALAFQLSIALGIVGSRFDFAYLGRLISIWAPMVALAPRIARKIVAPETGFW